MPKQNFLNITPELAEIFQKIEAGATPEEASIIYDDVAKIIESLALESHHFKCGIHEFYQEILKTYKGMESIALRGNAVLEITNNQEGNVIGLGEPLMPEMLKPTMDKWHALRVSAANQTSAPA